MSRKLCAFLELIALSAFLLLAASRPAQAYLDPGSGSYSLQVAVAGVFGALFSLKLFWRRIAGAVRGWAPLRTRARSPRRPGRNAP